MANRPTPAQDAARTRNWRIRSLRSLWAVAGQLSPGRATRVRAIIDEEFMSMGADTAAMHDAKVAARWEKEHGR